MAEETKRKPGRPKGVKVVEQRLVKYALNAGECIRENIPFIYILQFHAMRASGINAKWILNSEYLPIGIEPDPNSMLPTPTSTERSESLKFITQYGWGQPVQSTQVDIDIRARLDQLGSGASNQQIEGAFNPNALVFLKRALEEAKRLPAPDVIEAEWIDVKDEKPETLEGVTGKIAKNNPLPEDDSGESSNQ